MSDASPHRPGRVLLLLFGIFCCSTSVIFIRESTEHPVLLAAYRQIIAALALLPLYVRDRRRHVGLHTAAQLRAAAVGGAVLGIHFILWILGARMARAANATLIVNLTPLAMPFVLYALMREKLTRTEWLATTLAGVGVTVLALEDFHIDRTHAAGDLLCVLAMLLFALYLGLGRRNRDVPSLWLYVVPLYAAGGLFCLAVGAVLTDLHRVYTPYNLLMILGLALVPTVIGHSALNSAMKHMRGQVVTILNMLQFLFAGTMAYVLYDEVPRAVFYPCSALLLFAAWLVLRRRPAPVTRPPAR